MEPQQKPVSDQHSFEDQIAYIKQQAYSGPVPRPEDLQKYEQVQLGFADRLITMAEQEQKARILTSQKLVDLEIEAQAKSHNAIARGQWLGFVASLSVISLCFYAFYLGNANEARDIAVGVIALVAATFVTGKLISKKNADKVEA